MARLSHRPHGGGDTLRQALTTRMAGMPAWLLRSITRDQGAETARHVTITAPLGVPIHSCDSRSPWQRGSNENMNGLPRDYLPKGTSAKMTPCLVALERAVPGPAGIRTGDGSGVSDWRPDLTDYRARWAIVTVYALVAKWP